MDAAETILLLVINSWKYCGPSLGKNSHAGISRWDVEVKEPRYDECTYHASEKEIHNAMTVQAPPGLCYARELRL